MFNLFKVSATIGFVRMEGKMSKPKPTVIEYRNYDLPDFFPIVILDGDIWRISDRPSGVLHFHNCIEIGICQSDSGILELKNATYPFSSGDITLIGSDVCHTTYSTPGTKSKWSYLFVDFEQLLAPYFPISLFLDRKKYNDLVHRAFTILHSPENERIRSYVCDILDAYNQKASNYQFLIRGLALSLLICLINMESANSKPLTLGESNIKDSTLVISPALDYIRSNYMNEFSMDSLADSCHLSPTHFRRVFTQTLKTSPLDYLNQFRIEKAAFVLSTTNIPVIDVASDVGFRSISSFNRHFQTIMKTSPLKWRNQTSFIKKQSVLQFTGWMVPPQNE